MIFLYGDKKIYSLLYNLCRLYNNFYQFVITVMNNKYITEKLNQDVFSAHQVSYHNLLQTNLLLQVKNVLPCHSG